MKILKLTKIYVDTHRFGFETLLVVKKSMRSQYTKIALLKQTL